MLYHFVKQLVNEITWSKYLSIGLNARLSSLDPTHVGAVEQMAFILF